MADKPSSAARPFRSANWLYVESDALNPSREHVQASLTLDVIRDEQGNVREATILLEGQVLDKGALAEYLGGLTLDRLDVVEHLLAKSGRLSTSVEAEPEPAEQLSFGDLLAEKAALALAMGRVSADVPRQQVPAAESALVLIADEPHAQAC
jgi:hypothetical protein